jgi:hypothetical protein
VLVLIFWLSPVAPAFFADDTSKLPACCRRLGAHHCGLQLPGGVALKGVCDQYGHFPIALASPEYAKASVLLASEAVLASAPESLALAPQSLSRYRIAFNRSRQKRGPPSFRS